MWQGRDRRGVLRGSVFESCFGENFDNDLGAKGPNGLLLFR